ncbi:DUF3598 family protein [Streptosporangium sp. KLBMP 9127]|nr:hypothetical protein [Streptosporangium sp. KLBMP 9127]
MGIREGMPLLARHEGEWTGAYVHVDPGGKEIDRHASHLTCRFPADGSHDYLQTNRYTWDDGREEVHTFPGVYDGDGRMIFDTERIRGVTWCLDENTIYLTWRFKSADPSVDQRLFELIVLSDDGRHRSRTWQWLEHGVCVRRTLITERRAG